MRTLASLMEDLVPSGHIVTHDRHSSPRGSDVFFWPSQALGTRVVNTHAHTIDFLKGTLHSRGSTVKSHWLMASHLTVFLCSRFLPDMACAGQYGMLRLKSKRYFLMLKSLSTNNPGHQI